MSEEILKALMQLFAIIVKQDQGVDISDVEFVKNFLTQQLSNEQSQTYYSLFEEYAEIKDKEGKENDKGDVKRTSVRDSVRILGICKKINKTLTQNQKIIVLARLLELIGTEQKISTQRKGIIHTVAEVFNIDLQEMRDMENFVIMNHLNTSNHNLMIIKDQPADNDVCRYIQTEGLDKEVNILRITSVDLYFLKYTGSQDLFLNGLSIKNHKIYLFAYGSTIRFPKGKPIYFNDVTAHFLKDSHDIRISFEVKDVEYRFPNNDVGLRNINFTENNGKLIGIMGASGAGKTTLLNVLCGNEAPSKGQVLINHMNLHKEKNKIEGVIGLIPQDDLLIEELTVYENLFYNAKLCFKHKSKEELNELVDKTLKSLGLFEKKNLKVGSPFNKTISGGQRKRLNIALELIREPTILFVDEPTSGLSSRDSENVMDLLRELTLKGKLIFVVIHQPSSDIFKMFDKVVILDTGGYLIYYGNPVEAVMYFKKIDAQINSEIGECPTCGNVNPELIFSIIEAKVVDEFGQYTNKRKMSPTKWEEYFIKSFKPGKFDLYKEQTPKTLFIQTKINQFLIYLTRDIKSKISNLQYIALTMLEAPILGFILSYVIRYIENPYSDHYIYRENGNISIYIFMSLIVSLFLGLTVSAEEIFKDKKILKREAFLNLSRTSYLFSKTTILFLISAIQSGSFIFIANTILGIKDMYFIYWFALFTTAAFANMLGLNVSSLFNSAVTIYIVIPLIMIPMMLLSGAMFSFDKLNRTVGSVDKVPLIAEVMVTKWSYEALMVHQFKDNEFEKRFYELEKDESNADFKQVYYLPELEKKLEKCFDEYNRTSKIEKTKDDLELLRNECTLQTIQVKDISFDLIQNLQPLKFNKEIFIETKQYIKNLTSYYANLFRESNIKKNNIISFLISKNPDSYNNYKDDFFNDYISDQVKKVYEKNKILEYNHHLLQQVDPIYMNPRVEGFLNFRAHFLSPKKHFMGHLFDTFWFNMSVIWTYTILLYLCLYFNIFKALVNIRIFKK